ncbi:MAG: DUF4157 domain-containing protein [Terrimicrobiaceae bacterium]
MRGRGEPLTASQRGFFEPRFGMDFSAVRVHSGPFAGELARSLNARAFTHGSEIVFGRAEYNPGSSAGLNLLAHELTHVIQQRSNSEQAVQPEPASGTNPILEQARHRRRQPRRRNSLSILPNFTTASIRTAS